MPLFQAFYFSPEVSRTLPPKYARKGGPTYSMLITFKQAHELWLQKKGSKVSFNFFYKAKPSYVRKLGSIPPATCLCPKCHNVE